MIATIICVPSAIILAILAIIAIKEGEEGLAAISGITGLASIAIMMMFILFGYAKLYSLSEKHEIELMLKVEVSEYTVRKATGYNDRVDCCNDLWCRFSIEDRSGDYIDIDSYLRGQR